MQDANCVQQDSPTLAYPLYLQILAELVHHGTNSSFFPFPFIQLTSLLSCTAALLLPLQASQVSLALQASENCTTCLQHRSFNKHLRTDCSKL